MTAIRGARSAEGRYVQIKNSALQDGRLSLRARGVMALVLSLPPEQPVSAERLAAIAKEGRDAIRKAMNELEACGYLCRIRTKGGYGKVGTEVIITDDPDLLDSATDFQSPKSPDSGFSATGFQSSVDQAVKDKDGDKHEPPADAAKPSLTQVANRIATNACNEYKMQVFHKVRDAVTRALKDGKDPNDIAAAVRRLCEQDKPVGPGTLQVELRGGLNSGQRAPWQEPSVYDSSPASRGLDEVLW